VDWGQMNNEQRAMRMLTITDKENKQQLKLACLM
jgi:hypothetical protein